MFDIDSEQQTSKIMAKEYIWKIWQFSFIDRKRIHHIFWQTCFTNFFHDFFSVLANFLLVQNIFFSLQLTKDKLVEKEIICKKKIIDLEFDIDETTGWIRYSSRFYNWHNSVENKRRQIESYTPPRLSQKVKKIGAQRQSHFWHTIYIIKYKTIQKVWRKSW